MVNNKISCKSKVSFVWNVEKNVKCCLSSKAVVVRQQTDKNYFASDVAIVSCSSCSTKGLTLKTLVA